MGGSLSAPIKSQSVKRCGNGFLKVGVSEMQGFRATMEDSHAIFIPSVESKSDVAYFGVYDGHGGDKVIKILLFYCYYAVFLTRQAPFSLSISTNAYWLSKIHSIKVGTSKSPWRSTVLDYIYNVIIKNVSQRPIARTTIKTAPQLVSVCINRFPCYEFYLVWAVVQPIPEYGERKALHQIINKFFKQV
jgi:hypothetical protein